MENTKFKVEVSTSIYRRETGREPRGCGMWAFSIGNKEGYDDVEKAYFAYGSYSEAKRKAQEAARIKGTDIVWVLP